MNKSKLINMLLSLFLISSLTSCDESTVYLERDDWEVSVKDNLNTLMDNYKNDNNYVVFDFDNTSCIFDIEEQLSIYQIETMSFAIKPAELKDVLLTDLSTDNPSICGYNYFVNDTKDITYSDLCDDIVSAYTNLYTNYGPFDANGLSKEKQELIHNEDDYKEFSTKLRMMYDLVYSKESSSVAYPWVLYWFYGMSQDEVYNLAYKSHEKYSKVETYTTTWSTSGIDSITGAVDFTFTNGITVTENIKELYKTFTENNIDVYICSASSIDVVKAAIDYFGLHDYCKGVLAMTNSLVDGKYTNHYDYSTGYGYNTGEDMSWTKMITPTEVQTQGVGKVTAINNTLYKYYGKKGPIAGFMDSTGDFNFCSQYDSLKLVVCFNRANRKVTDGGGLIAALAMYQKDVLNYDLEKANKNGDTLYLLQGRDENNLRSLRNSNSSMLYGKEEEQLYKNEDNLKLYNYFKDNNLDTKTIIDTYSIKTTNDTTMGFTYGFLTSYGGYHSITDK